jgi:hypothetical protein
MADHNQQQGIVLDALPYAETVHEDYEAYALTLVEEEMKINQPDRTDRASSPQAVQVVATTLQSDCKWKGNC